MSTIIQYPHLSFDEDGEARVDRTRYKVIHLAGEHYHYGWSAEEILRQHPDPRPEQIYAALTYFYDHHEAMVQAMRETAAVADRDSAKQPITRAELLKRRAARECSSAERSGGAQSPREGEAPGSSPPGPTPPDRSPLEWTTDSKRIVMHGDQQPCRR